MPESPRSVFDFPDFIPPFSPAQVFQLTAALRVRRESPNLFNTNRVRRVIAHLFRLPVESHAVFDIMTVFFARGHVGSYHVGNTMEEVRQSENNPDAVVHNLTPVSD